MLIVLERSQILSAALTPGLCESQSPSVLGLARIFINDHSIESPGDPDTWFKGGL